MSLGHVFRHVIGRFPNLRAASAQGPTTLFPLDRYHGDMDTTIVDQLNSLEDQAWDTPLKDSYLLGFDTETTGTRYGTDAIASASLVLRDPAAGFPGDRISQWIINPGVPMNPFASQVNGFTDAYLQEHGQDQAEAIGQIAETILLAQSKRIPLLAYNAPFDVAMLDGDLRRLGDRNLNQQTQDLGHELLIVDPLVLDRSVSHRKGKRTLTDTTYYYGVQPHGSFHDATADTIAAVDLVAPMVTLYPQVGQLDLASLMDWQRQAHEAWKDQFNDYLISRGRRPVTDSWFPRNR